MGIIFLFGELILRQYIQWVRRNFIEYNNNSSDLNYK